jgi:hypothetical protein
MTLKRILLWFRFNVLSRFVAVPTSFTWSVADFNQIRNWSLCQPHPRSETLTLWDELNDLDSAWTLKKAELWIKEGRAIGPAPRR